MAWQKIKNFYQNNQVLSFIIFTGLCLRLLVLFFYPDQNFPDANGYAKDGKNFFKTGMLATNLHMPLYIIWTHLMGKFLKFSDVIFSTLSIITVYFLSKEIFKNHKTGIIAAGIMAIYPHCLFYATSRLTETSYVFLLLLSFLYMYRGNFLYASILMVLGILIRPTLDLFCPILIIIFAKFIHNLCIKDTLKKMGIYFLCYGCLMSPWWIHNYVKYDCFVRLNLGDGYILYSGNNPVNKSGGGVSYGGGNDDLDMSQFSQITNPIQKNNLLKQKAIEFITENPLHFIKMAMVKFIRFWRLWPYTPDYSDLKIILLSIFSYGTVLLLSIFFSIRERKLFVKMSPIYGLILYLTMVHIITIGSIRYRFPLEPFLIMMAGNFVGLKNKNGKNKIGCGGWI